MTIAALAAICCIAAAPQARGFSGQLGYTGALGPVGVARPLCICIYSDAALAHELGCLIVRSNPAQYSVALPNDGDYFAITFLDIHINERLDPDEPFEIYRDRSAAPADAIPGGTGPTDVDFVFGDENLPGEPTSTPTETVAPGASATITAMTAAPATPTGTVAPSASATATTAAPVTPTATAPPLGLPGDCNANGIVSIDELIRAVAIALGSSDLSVCPAADLNGDGVLRINELVRAVTAALE